MLLEVSSKPIALDDQVFLSYFVRQRSRKTPRVGSARLIDISEAGLCMEISPFDSDLFLESQGRPFILSRDIEIQIFCRSHPINISVSGAIKWFKRKKDIEVEAGDESNVCIGVIFTFHNGSQRKEMVELVRRLKNEAVRCRNCGSRISPDALVCYNCAVKPVRKRALLRKWIFGFLTDDSG